MRRENELEPVPFETVILVVLVDDRRGGFAEDTGGAAHATVAIVRDQAVRDNCGLFEGTHDYAAFVAGATGTRRGVSVSAPLRSIQMEFGARV